MCAGFWICVGTKRGFGSDMVDPRRPCHLLSFPASITPLSPFLHRQRLWGAVSWGVAATLMGVIIQATGIEAIFAGLAIGCAAMVCLVVCGWGGKYPKPWRGGQGEPVEVCADVACRRGLRSIWASFSHFSLALPPCPDGRCRRWRWYGRVAGGRGRRAASRW